MSEQTLVPPSACASWSRREVLRHGFLSAGALATLWLPAHGEPQAHARLASMPRRSRSLFDDLGELLPPDANGIRLPAGYVSRIVAVSGEPPRSGLSYRWHSSPDGGATFATADGGWIYANNSEVPLFGGVGALRFDRRGRVVDAFPLLQNTTANCAGGPTPWNTWLSCEEFDLGTVWETYPLGGIAQARQRTALGIFTHEAVAVDPHARILYLTEDDSEGRFYRFVPSERDWPADAPRPALQDGRLQVLKLAELGNNRYPPADFDLSRPRQVQWLDVQFPELPQSLARGLSGRFARGSVFRGGEGLWWFEGIVYFATKGDNRVWAYDHGARTLQTIYDFASAPDNILSGVDNLTVSSLGDVLVAEDGGDMQLCAILPDHRVVPLLQVTGQDDSEITGPAFSPDGRRLYFNSQRGGRSGAGPGITYEVSLPAGV